MQFQLQDLSNLLARAQSLLAIESPLTERDKVLAFIFRITLEFQLPLFYWNQGYGYLQKVSLSEAGSVFLIPTEEEVSDGLSWLLSYSEAGLFVFEGALAPDSTGELEASKQAQISNLAFKLATNSNEFGLKSVLDVPSVSEYGVNLIANSKLQIPNSYRQVLLCLEAYVELPKALIPFVCVLFNSFPTPEHLRSICNRFCTARQLGMESDGQMDLLTRACLAIPERELEMALRYLSARVTTVAELAQAMLDYKKNKFRGRGIEFIGEPDVPEAAGLELFDAMLERSAALLRPEAAAHNLSFTRGILLWGPPGTGKSLSAKLAARKMNVPLIAVDWAGLRGATAYESHRNLKEFLDTIDALGEGGLILYFDDFDKGFAGFDANNDGGISRQLTGKLLTWMQEHTSKVLLIATVNRLGFLPPELIRRFEENIYFVDLPHAGARYEIFNLHLRKYFPDFHFSDREWQKLLHETHLLTPAEMGNMVKRTASEIFYQNTLKLNFKRLEKEPLKVTILDLLEQRYTFTPSMIRDEDQIVAIRNQASYARPASAPDTSEWARNPPSLFEEIEARG